MTLPLQLMYLFVADYNLLCRSETNPFNFNTKHATLLIRESFLSIMSCMYMHF